MRLNSQKKGDDDKTGDFDQILGDLPHMGLREGEASTHMRPFPETKQARDELKVGSDRLERPWVTCCLFRSNSTQHVLKRQGLILKMNMEPIKASL